MRNTTTYAALAATALWATTALAGETVKQPTAPVPTPQITMAVSHGAATVSDVGWRRARRNGYYGYRPYYSYRPYYGGYGYGYGGYYTRPYYGYSYYAPGWGYAGWGPGYGLGWGVAPVAPFGGWYW